MEFITDPYSWWVEPFVENLFMRNALWVSLLAVISTSVIGTWVILRGLSFLSDALAHGVLPGVAIAFIIGADLAIGGLAAALFMVLGVTFVGRKSKLPEDTAIGLLFVGFLALAVVLLSKSHVGDLNRFLFGSVTGVTSGDLWRQAAAAFLAVGTTVFAFRPLLISTFDETQAALAGMKPKTVSLALNVVLAVVIVFSFQTVGNLLVFAFLIGPPATAALLAREVKRMIPLAVAFGVTAAITGLTISYHLDTAASATMALCSVAIFVVVLVGQSTRETLIGAGPR